MRRLSGHRRRAAVACCALVATVAVLAVIRSGSTSADVSAATGALAAARAQHRPAVVFVKLGAPGGVPRGRLSVAPAAAGSAGRPVAEPLDCARAYFAGGRGLCVAPAAGGAAAGYRVREFDSRMRLVHELSLPGVPSRARVSPDGRYGSVTFFVTGHAYAAPGAFSTDTTLIDMRTGRAIGELEDFSTSRNGRIVTAVDANYWGVTFARDDDTFYATMATGGRTYLIKGSISHRTARVITGNVECPSLSPDGKRIAFKKLVGPEGRWRLTVLDLRTMRETPLAETRSVDDQAEWLNDTTVLYGVDRGVWAVSADGSGAPRRYIAGAASPAVVRW